jgi:hypothetical protein
VAVPLGPRFAKLWTASTTSALGSGLAMIAALYVAAHTRNPLIVAATSGVAWLPWLLFALPGGVLVDRVDRRRLMVTIDRTRVVAMGVLATALLAGWSSIALLDAVLFVINTGEVVFRSASQAMISSVVPRAGLERANGWLVGGTTLMQNMIAGPFGGFLFVLAACVPFYVNAGTYAAQRGPDRPGRRNVPGLTARGRRPREDAAGGPRPAGAGRRVPLAGRPAGAAHDDGPDRAAEPDPDRGGQVRHHRALLGRVRGRGPRVRQHLAGVRPGRGGRGLRRARAVRATR